MHSELADDFYSESTESFNIMKFAINIESNGNALTLLVFYPFETLQLAMSLTNRANGNIVAIEKISSLEDIESDERNVKEIQFN